MPSMDSYESNNTLSTATNLTSSTSGSRSFTIHSSSDVDYIKIDLDSYGTSSNYVSIDNISGGDIDMQLYDANGNLLSTSNYGGTSSERISLSGRSAGTYYVRVWGWAGATGSYRFNFNTYSAVSSTDTNTSFATAATITPSYASGVFSSSDYYISSSTDVDYYRFTLNRTGTSSNYIGINLTHYNGDLDIRVYDSNHNQVGSSTSCGNTERVYLTGLSAGTYYMKVYGFSGARGNYSIAYNLPLTAAIAGDRYESNNSTSTATNFTTIGSIGTVENLTIHTTSDYDYYKFTLAGPGSVNDYLRINFTHSVADLDMVLLNSSGSTVGGSYSCSNQENISLNGLAAGTYYLKVYSWRGTGSYDLSYHLPSALPTDSYESNDTRPTASTAFLNGGSGNAVISTSTDDDWFKIDLNHTGTTADKVRINFSHSAGDIDLFLYNAAGTLLKCSRGVTNTEELNLSGYLAGTYYVKVEGYNGATGAYSINVSLASAPVGLAADGYDSGTTNNNSFDTAVDLRTLSGANSVGSNLTIHSSSDVDYYKFTIAERGGVNDSILVNHIYSRGDIDMKLYRKNSDNSYTCVRSGLSCSNYEDISLSGLDAGTYYLKVYGFSGATNSYALSYTVDQYSATNITADSYESQEPIAIRQSQTINNLSISEATTGVTRADTFSIELAAAGTATSKIVFSNYRSDWTGLAWQLKSGNTVLSSGTGSTVSLNGRAAGTYTLVVDTPTAGEYSNYSVTATLPTAPAPAPSTPSDPSTPSTPTTPAPSTPSTADERLAVLVYVAADNNLESAALGDLLEMQRANVDAGVDVYVMVDRCAGYATGDGNWTDTRVGKIVHNSSSNIVVDWTSWGELNTGSASTLTRFLNWGASQANADKYAVIMWDHGGAMTGGMSDNASNSDHLTMAEMRTGFLNADAAFRDKLMVVGFDACLMGAAEVVESFNGIADYVVASEESIGNSGWNYTSMLNRLEGSMNAEEIATAMVDAGEDSNAVWTLSAIQADGALTTALNAFGTASSNFSSSDWSKIATAFRNAHSYSYAWMVDLVDVLNRISGGSTALTTAVTALKDALVGENSDNIVLRNYADGSSYGQGNGIAVINPITGGNSVMNYFTSNLSLGNSSWGSFLRTLAGRDHTAPNASGSSGNDTSHTIARQNAFGEVVLSNYSQFRSDVPYTASNLGVFSGRGMELTDLHVSAGDKKYFIFDLGSNVFDLNGQLDPDSMYDMENGDCVVFNVADNKSITVKLTDVTGNTVYTTTGGSGTVTLNLNVEGLNDQTWTSAQTVVMEVTSLEDVTYSMNFEARWSTGVDYFDYALGGMNTSRIPDAGNNIISKATTLVAGSYGGLLTHSTDHDYYKIDASRLNQNVVVTGDDLIVEIRDANDEFVRSAVNGGGCYRLTLEEDDYLYISSTRNITSGLGENLSTYSITVGNRLNTIASATASDFNGNSISDILFQNLTDSANPLGAWMDADDTQWVGDLGPAPLDQWTVYGAHDFTGDGVSDIIFRSKRADTEYAVGYYDMGRNREFKTMGWGVTAEWDLAGIGDFNGNGTSDVLWQNSTNGYLGCWLDGTNQWVALPASQLVAGQEIVGIGDMNDDYQDDIILNSNGVLGAWDISDIIAGEPNSMPEWQAFGITLSNDWNAIGGGDFDGNGEFDIVIWNQNSGFVGTYMNCEANDFRTIFPNALTTEWGIPGFGDYNGDGCDDVLVRNLATGALGFWDGADDFRWNAIGFGVDSTWSVIA